MAKDGIVHSSHMLKKAVCIGGLLLLVALLAGPAGSADRKLPVMRQDELKSGQGTALDQKTKFDAESLRIRAEKSRQIHDLLGSHLVSQKSLKRLESQGLGPALLRGGPQEWTRQPLKAAPDTLRILLIRIGFETDLSGDRTSVTEDGDFLLEGDPDAVPDPPPHDKTYFETQIRGLEYFYNSQSNGRLTIDATVMPPGQNDCYKLSDITDYIEDGGWTIASLEALVRAMVEVADDSLAATEYNLADFDDDNEDAYVIFAHAGADWQSDILGDSPNDIPTFFISFGEAVELVGQGGEPGFMSECSIIPETTTQDGYAGGILGAFCHEFGHAFGLPDIYSPATGAVNGGYWTLMDSGTNLYGAYAYDLDHDGVADTQVQGPGILPVSLGPWEKWYLGWLDFEVFDGRAREIKLPAIQVARTEDEYLLYRRGVPGWDYSGSVPGTDYAYSFPGYDFDLEQPQALIGGVSANEFFIVENRWVPDGPFDFPDISGVGAVHAENQVILYMGGDPETPGMRDFRNSGMYDYFMPATGLLVWHVNMDRILAGLEDNSVNDWADGLRIVEADGITDIGISDPFYYGWAGSHRDPFNDIMRDPEEETIWDTLFADRAPSSRAFDRSWTGFEFSGAAGVDTNRAVMRIDVSNERLAGGGLIDLPDGRRLDVLSVTPCEVTVASSPTDAIFCADAAPVDWIGPGAFGASLLLFDSEGESLLSSGAVVASLGAPLAGPLLNTDVAGTGGTPASRNLLVAGTTDGRVHGWDLDLTATDALVEAFVPVDLGSTLASAPLRISDELILCCVGSDSLVLLDGAGTRVGGAVQLTGPMGLPVDGFIDAPRALTAEGTCVVFSPDGWFHVAGDETGLLAVARDWPMDISDTEHLRTAVLAAADSDMLVVIGEEGIAASWTILPDGTITENNWNDTVGRNAVSEMAVADLDGDGRNDLVLMTSTEVHALARGGIPLSGFPVEINGLFPVDDSPALVGGLVVCDASGSAANEILLRTEGGHLVGLDARGDLLDAMPFLIGDDTAASLAVGPCEGSGRTLWIGVSGGGTSDLSGGMVEAGRLCGYHLVADHDVSNGSSEWLGSGGGIARGGPVGVPRNQGSIAPAASDADRFIVYPNPLQDEALTIRFQTPVDNTARLVIYNLEGEIVGESNMQAVGGQVNEFPLVLPQLASGLYICQLDRETSSGRQKSVVTLAVEK